MDRDKFLGRTRQPREVRESDILTSAYAIFSEKGYEKAAMSEIARQSGVAEGTVYKYFANKQELLARVIAEFYIKLIKNTEESLVGVKGVENQLRVLISRHIQIFFEDMGMCRLMLQEVRPLNSYAQSPTHKLTKRYSEILLGIIEDAAANGEFIEGVSPKTVRDMIFGCLEHAGWNVLALKKTRIDTEQLTDEIMTIILSGLKPPQTQQQDFDRSLVRLEKLVDRLEQNQS